MLGDALDKPGLDGLDEVVDVDEANFVRIFAAQACVALFEAGVWNTLPLSRVPDVGLVNVSHLVGLQLALHLVERLRVDPTVVRVGEGGEAFCRVDEELAFWLLGSARCRRVVFALLRCFRAASPPPAGDPPFVNPMPSFAGRPSSQGEQSCSDRMLVDSPSLDEFV